jgi:peptide chain release factor 1
MSLELKLDKVLQRFAMIRDQLSTGTVADPQEFAKLSKEFSDLTPLAEQIMVWQKKRQELEETRLLVAASGEDPVLKNMAQEEIHDLEHTISDLENAIKVLLLPKDEADDRNVIVEIRAGTGGEEAALFAADLLRMYQRYADIKSWGYELFDVSDTGLGGIREASLNIRGKGAYARLKFESGVAFTPQPPQLPSSLKQRKSIFILRIMTCVLTYFALAAQAASRLTPRIARYVLPTSPLVLSYNSKMKNHNIRIKRRP